MFEQKKGFPRQFSHQRSTSQSYWQNAVKNEQNNHVSAVTNSRSKMPRRIAEPSSIGIAREKIRASTELQLDNVGIEIDASLREQGKRAVAETGNIVRFASASDTQDHALALHEMLHIAQQRGGSSNVSQGNLDEAQAEQELGQVIKKVQYRHPACIGRTHVRCLYQGTAASQDFSKSEQDASKGPPLGQGNCVVLYLDGDDVAFPNTAKKHVQERPNRCYAWRNNKVEKNQAMPFRTGENIIEALKHVASEVGKISEVYILSHGYSGGILALSSDRTEYSTQHGLSAATKAKAPQNAKGIGHSSQAKTSCNQQIGRSIGDIQAIAKDCFTPNVAFVIHACRSSEKPYGENKLNEDGQSFSEALYLALESELGENASVYGHQGTTKAGYNCAWHKHNHEKPQGDGKELPPELLYGSYTHCRSEDLKDGQATKIAMSPRMTKRRR